MLKPLPNIALTMIWSRAIKRLLGARGKKGQLIFKLGKSNQNVAKIELSFEIVDIESSNIAVIWA